MAILNCMMVLNQDPRPKRHQLNKSKDHGESGEICCGNCLFPNLTELGFYFPRVYPRAIGGVTIT